MERIAMWNGGVSALKIIVIGGGCFGRAQTGRLLRAMEMGAIPRAVISIVDRNDTPPAFSDFGNSPGVEFVRSDWASFLDGYFSRYSAGSGDMLVPAHIAPHLLFETARSYLSRSTGLDTSEEKVTGRFDLPFDREGPGGIRYISAAAWLCPFACIEPEVCPATRGERSWDLSKLVPRVMDGKADLTAVFKTEHYAWGVGTISCDSIADAYGQMVKTALSSGRGISVVVATTSNCHGVVGRFRVG